MKTIIALTGFMAAGKTTVGRALGSLLHWNFIDLDFEIEQRAKMGIHEIFALRGEAFFRELESATLRSLLASVAAPLVVALGGGTFVQAENAQQMRNAGCWVVFLELPLDELLRRCRAASGRTNSRPLAADEAAFSALYHRRLPLYRHADLTVNAAGKSCQEIAHEIAKGLRLSGSEASSSATSSPRRP